MLGRDETDHDSLDMVIAQLELSKLFGLSQLLVGSPRWAFGYRCGCTIGHLTVGDFAVAGVPTFSVRISSELLRDGREGRTPMAWHFPV